MKNIKKTTILMVMLNLLLILCFLGECVQNNSSSLTFSSTNQNESLVKSYIKDLKNDTAIVRMTAASNLGDLGDKSAVMPLIEVLNNDNNRPVRMNAAYSLGKLKDERAIEPLITILKNDQDSTIRGDAAKALGEIKDKRAFEPLMDALKKDEVWTVKKNAATALGKFGDKRAIPPLVEVLGNRLIYTDVAKALAMIGEPAVEPLIDALKGPGQEGAIIALGLIGDKRATEPIIEIMKKEHLYLIPVALGKIKDKRAVLPLVEQIPQMKTFNGVTLTEISYRRRVVIALGEIGPDAKDAVPALLELVQNPGERGSWSGDVAAGIGSQPGSVRVYEGMGDRVGAILEAIDALGKIGDYRAVPVLEMLTSDSDWYIQQRAREALQVIKG